MGPRPKSTPHSLSLNVRFKRGKFCGQITLIGQHQRFAGACHGCEDSAAHFTDKNVVLCSRRIKRSVKMGQQHRTELQAFHLVKSLNVKTLIAQVCPMSYEMPVVTQYGYLVGRNPSLFE